MSALYVHIPFCSSKCHYCAFSVVTKQDEQEAYITELLKEMKERLPLLSQVDTLYIGGGTPSLLRRNLLEQLFAHLPRPSEITMECNPEQVDEDFVNFLKQLGITRISLGVQTLLQDTLTAMNRLHTTEQARKAMTTLKHSGLSWNIDLILGLPGVTHIQFLEDLEEVLAYEPPHVSCYFLSVEPGTVLSRNYEASDDDVELYNTVCTRLREAGFDHTELSNWSQPGHACRHNLHYWHGNEYLGLGLSASSYISDAISTNTRNLRLYLEGQWQSEASLPLSRRGRLELLLTASTRLAEGLSWSTLAPLCTPAELQQLQQSAATLTRQGLLHSTEDSIIVQESAFPLHNAIVQHLLSALPQNKHPV